MAIYKDDANLVALWSLDEAAGATRLDYTANNNDLTDVNTVGQDADFKEGTAAADFEFDNSEYLYITDAAQIGLDLMLPFSIVLWVKLESLAAGAAGLICKTDWAFDCAYALSLIDIGTIVPFLALSSDGSSYDVFGADSAIGVGAWVHVAVVADGVDVRFYQNGILDSAAPGAWTDAVWNSSQDFIVGQDAAGSFFDGLLDEIAIFSRALSADEIASIYSDGIQEPAGPVVVSPAPASMVMATTAPGVVLGSITVAPAAGSMVMATPAPGVVLGSVTVAPAAGSMVMATTAPGAVLGSVTVAPAAGSLVMATTAPGAVLGSVTVAPAAGSMVMATTVPGVVLGSVMVAPAAGSFVVATVGPVVVLSVFVLITGYIDQQRSIAGYVDQGRAITGYVDQAVSKAGYIDQAVSKAGYIDESVSITGYI